MNKKYEEISSKINNSIDTQLFFIVDFQICYETEEYCVPVEVCIQPFVFSLPEKYADSEIYHAVIKQSIPLEHFLSAKHYCEKQHGLCFDLDETNTIMKDSKRVYKLNNNITEDMCKERTDYAQFWRDMTGYMQTVYANYTNKDSSAICITQSMNKTLKCIEYIAKVAKQDYKKSLFKNMFSIQELYLYMNRKINSSFNVNVIMNFYDLLLTGDSSESDARCEYHKKITVRSFCCSKTNVAHFLFVLSQTYNAYRKKMQQNEFMGRQMQMYGTNQMLSYQ